MNKIFLLIVLILIPLSVFAFDCGDHLSWGTPSGADQMLCRSGYAVGYSYAAKQPFWVAYHLTDESVSPSLKRSNDFREDDEIPAQYRSKLSDYKGSGYDRGHLAPNAAMDSTYQSMSESFLLSNMSPQKKGLNRFGWRFLEEDIRKWTVDRGNLFVCTGPLFEGELTAIGKGVIVPSHFWKVIFDPNKMEMIGFIFPHTYVPKDDVEKYRVTVDEIEMRASMDFFSLLEDDTEISLENSLPDMWQIKDPLLQ
jgi:endonuclease G